jgi:hypothetical protein
MVEKSYYSLVNISLNMHGARAVQATRDHPVAIPWPLHFTSGGLMGRTTTQKQAGKLRLFGKSRFFRFEK